MAATLIARAKEVRDDGSIVEIVIRQLPDPLPLSAHPCKYRLYYGASGHCRVRYDNERDKGVTIGTWVSARKAATSSRSISCWTTSNTTLTTGGDA